MIKAVLLLFEPVRTWDRIALAERGVGFILFTYVLPLLVLVGGAEAWGMIHWGDWRGAVLMLKKYTLPEAVGFQLMQLSFQLFTLFLGAKLLLNLGETFHGRHTYTQAFTALAYGLGPFWMLRLLDLFPAINPWVSFGLGIVLTIAVLYYGIPRVMMPDPPQAFGLYLMGSLLLLIIAGLGRFIIVWLQQGRFAHLEEILTRIAAAVLPG